MNKLTKRQAQVISAYTGMLCCKGEDLHLYVEEVLGRYVPVFEMGMPGTRQQIKEASREEFMAMLPLDDERPEPPEDAT